MQNWFWSLEEIDYKGAVEHPFVTVLRAVTENKRQRITYRWGKRQLHKVMQLYSAGLQGYT